MGVGENPRETLSELGKLWVMLIIQRAVEDEFDAWLGRVRYERRLRDQPRERSEEGGLRNGFRPRTVQTAEAELELEIEIPQVRQAAETFALKLSRAAGGPPEPGRLPPGGRPREAGSGAARARADRPVLRTAPVANPTTVIPRRLAAPALRRASAATGVLVALLIAAAAVLMYAGRHLTFFADEWVWILHRRGGGISSLLEPYNDHFSLFPLAAVDRLLFALVGIRHYKVYRAVGVGLHLVCAVLLYILIRRQVGPWLALVPTTLLLFMGTAAQDLLWPIAIGFLGSIAGGLGALALIENRRSDALAAVLLVFSIASSGVGLAFLVAGLVAIIARRDPWSRLWVIAMPALVVLAWYAGWGQSKPVTVSAILGVPASIANAAAGVSSAIAGLNTATGPTVVNPWGPAIALVGVLVVAVSWRQNVGRQPTPMLLAAVAGVLWFWGLVALQRYAFANLNTSRYLYIGAVFVWLIVAEARVGTKLTSAWLAFAGLLAAGALIANLGDLHDAEIGLRTHDEESRRRESHPPALTEPGVNLSAHRAPIVQPSGRTPHRQ